MARRRTGVFFNPNFDPVSGLLLHPDTYGWVNATRELGGSVTTTRLIATDSFVKWAYAMELRDRNNTAHKIKFWLPLASSTFAGAFVSLWHPQGIGTQVFNSGFVSADYSVINGLQGSKTKYLNSLCTSNDVARDSAFLAADVNTNAFSDNEPTMGFLSFSPSPSYGCGIWPGDSVRVSLDMPDPNVATGDAASIVNSTIGFYVGVRDGDNVGFYKDNITIEERTQPPLATFGASQPILLSSVYIVPFDDFLFYASTKLHRGFFIGSGLNREEAKSFSIQYQSWRNIVRA